MPENYEPLLYLYIKNSFYSAIPVFAVSLFAGIKINYFLKISCGDFIDSKRAVLPFLVFFLTGMIIGILLSITFYYFKEFYFYSGILLLPIIPTVFLLKLSYNPAPIYAQESKRNIHTSGPEANNQKRDDLFFIYLNFTYILIYIFLGFTSIIKYYGDLIYVKILFIFISLLSASIGIFFARLFKRAFWYVYAEMLYPVLFIISIVLLILFKDKISVTAAVCIFIPLTIILTFALFQAINHILSANNHKNRFNVINFSLLILPAPILISLNFIEFTYFWYFVLLYIISLMNIFIPGIYLTQSIVKAYKKLIFFICALIFIPLLILIHMYFNIPLNRNLYITGITGFDSLKKINYNSQYIENEGTVRTHGIKLFQANDPTIRNIKRAIAPVLLYANNKTWNEALFIDGNRKFFKNPVISLLKNTNCLDYITDRFTDYKTLPISGDQNFVLDHSEILSFLNKKKSPYKIIVDIPNLFDQALNAFRFSKEYYNFINNKLFPEGIFVHILSAESRSDYITEAANNIKNTFKKTIVYYFPNYFVLLSSNDPDSLKINYNNIKNFKEVFDTTNELKNIFYNEFHMLSHILFLEIDDFLIYTNKVKTSLFSFQHRQDNFISDKNPIAGFTDNNSLFIDLIDKSGTNLYFYNSIQNQFRANNYFLSEVKKAELYEANKEYEAESLQLINLRRQSEYKPDLIKYIRDILIYKEDYYYTAALKFEKDKKWEEARKLYKAILIMNKNHFEANYHLGILSIILQDLDASFEYLQYAMKLKKDDPKVLYQMGVLLFSSGRYKEALVYLERALALKEKTASIFYYTGLCYEELNNLSTALNYYNQAIAIDPNDKNIISGIERIKEKIKLKQGEFIQNEKNSYSEVEKGEDMPLPVTETAINVRLEEDKTKKEEEK